MPRGCLGTKLGFETKPQSIEKRHCIYRESEIMKLINIAKVIELTSLSRSTIYQKISDGSFPAQKRITSRRVGWVYEEIEAWMMAL
jgi:prophage regulatory protein